MEEGRNMTTDDGRIWELVEQAARAASDDLGRFSAKGHKDELVRLLENVDIPRLREITNDLAARKYVESFARRRNPQERNGQSAIPTLYDDSFVLVLEDTIRVWMVDATQQDLIVWEQRTAEKTARTMDAQRKRKLYVEARLTVWRGRRDIQKLGDLERHFFGYEPRPLNPEDDDEAEGTL